MYSTYNEGKFVVAESFIRSLKDKIYNTWQLHQKILAINNSSILDTGLVEDLHILKDKLPDGKELWVG